METWGMAAFGELLRMPEIRELALAGRNAERIRAEADGYADAQALHAASGSLKVLPIPLAKRLLWPCIQGRWKKEPAAAGRRIKKE